jgi:hAT family C-terminal dimerisation region
MDYLPIQASAVPCERVFSSSAETDTKKRNRIKPELMEALQILKFALKKERLNFTDHLHLPEASLNLPDAQPPNELSKMLKMNPETFSAYLKSIDLAK